MEVFVDERRKVAQKVLNIKNAISEGHIGKVKSLLEEALREDPYYLETYVLLSEIYELEGDLKKAESLLKEAFAKAKELLKGFKRADWENPNNAHVFDAILNYAIFLWETGRPDEALEVLKWLYSFDPEDKKGLRYYILALLEGMDFAEFEQVFTREGKHDTADLEGWFKRTSKKYESFFKSLER